MSRMRTAFIRRRHRQRVHLCGRLWRSCFLYLYQHCLGVSGMGWVGASSPSLQLFWVFRRLGSFGFTGHDFGDRVGSRRPKTRRPRSRWKWHKKHRLDPKRKIKGITHSKEETRDSIRREQDGCHQPTPNPLPTGTRPRPLSKRRAQQAPPALLSASSRHSARRERKNRASCTPKGLARQSQHHLPSTPS